MNKTSLHVVDAALETFVSDEAAHLRSPIEFVDPLDPDLTTDQQVTLSHRQLLRLVYVAAETGARFARQGDRQDPVAWLFEPFPVFDGANALNACHDLRSFQHALIVAGLHLTPSMAPSALEPLCADTGNEDSLAGDLRTDSRGAFKGTSRILH